MSTDRPGDKTPVESLSQLCAAFEPKEPVRGRLGVEWEQLPVDPSSRLVPYAGERGVESLLAALSPPHEAVRENGHVTAVRLRGGGMVALEPGGQVEIASPPVDSLETVHRFLARVLKEVDGEARRRGFRLVPWGVAPHNGPEDLPDVPKRRYLLLKRHLEAAGARGRRMMKLTAATQVALDYQDEADMAAKTRGALAALPYLVAFTANAPVAGGRRTRWLSQRPWIWRGTDPRRCGVPGFLFSERLGYAELVRYALDRPVLFLMRNGAYVPVGERTFRRLLKSPGELGPVTLEDWDLHLSTCFPEVRLRGYVEIRTLDSLPLPLAMAAAALFKGLLALEGPLAEWDALRPAYTPALLRRSLLEAARYGPHWQPPVGPPAEVVLRKMLMTAAEGLVALGENPCWLAPLRELVERSSCPADFWRRDEAGVWRGPEDPDPVF
ncbi:MAG: glutamate-cysteine ligase family protein [Acidobacteriota bacterium]